MQSTARPRGFELGPNILRYADLLGFYKPHAA